MSRPKVPTTVLEYAIVFDWIDTKTNADAGPFEEIQVEGEPRRVQRQLLALIYGRGWLAEDMAHRTLESLDPSELSAVQRALAEAYPYSESLLRARPDWATAFRRLLEGPATRKLAKPEPLDFVRHVKGSREEIFERAKANAAALVNAGRPRAREDAPSHTKEASASAERASRTNREDVLAKARRDADALRGVSRGTKPRGPAA